MKTLLPLFLLLISLSGCAGVLPALNLALELTPTPERSYYGKNTP